METFKILVEQTNAKNEINFSSKLSFRAVDESNAFNELADYLVDFVNLQATLKERGVGVLGAKGLTKSGNVHVTLKRGGERPVEFGLKKFGVFLSNNRREQVAEVLGLVYGFIDKHSSKVG